jgi:predicted nucleotidyltransferase component of viral defense system
MTKRDVRDIAASVKQRLLNVHAEKNIDFNFLLTRYAVECFLHRLDRSRYKESFVLKGAMLFYAWKGEWFRSTRDLDFLGFEKNDPENLKRIFREICATNSEQEDGLVFVPESITTEAIMEESNYPGVKVHIALQLGKARSILQIDVGFGDKITPGIKLLKFPSVLKDRELTVKAYPVETVIAEKFEAMVSRGQENSRLKDFYDLWVIARTFSLKGSIVIRAIQATCKQRGTVLLPELPLALTTNFYENKSVQWLAFINRNSLTNIPSLFSEVGECLIAFFEPLLSAIAARDIKSFKKNWRPNGKWILRPEKITGAKDVH